MHALKSQKKKGGMCVMQQLASVNDSHALDWSGKGEPGRTATANDRPDCDGGAVRLILPPAASQLRPPSRQPAEPLDMIGMQAKRWAAGDNTRRASVCALIGWWWDAWLCCGQSKRCYMEEQQLINGRAAADVATAAYE